MSAVQDVQNTTQNAQENGQKVAQNDKEHNFALIRQQLEREKQEKLQMRDEIEKLKKIAESKLTASADDDDNDDEPYIDKKRLKKELGRVVQQTSSETETKIEAAVNKALGEERQRNWLSQHSDFEEIMQHAQKVQDSDPELAEIILNMPNTFERHKLVYKHIKATGLHQPKDKAPSIQEKVDANRRSPYYQPSGLASPGYGVVNGGKDYSPADGKNAYDKMQALKNRLRLG